MSTTYPSDLPDTEWECLLHYLRASRSDCRTRRHSLRSILNAIFCVLRTLQTSETPIELAMIRVLVARPGGRTA